MSKERFVLELELDLNRDQKQTLDKKLRIAKQIYNTVLNECLKRLHKVHHDRNIQSLFKELKNLKSDDPARKRIREEIYVIEQSYGYTEYDMHSFVADVKHYFHDAIGIDECQKLATRAFKAVQKVHYHQAKCVNFKAKDDDMSIEGKSYKSTIHLNKDGTVSFKELKNIRLIVKKKDFYAMEALGCETKYVRILTRTVRGKVRYYAQLIQVGTPPKKKRKTGRKNRRVGLDEGTTTIAVSSGNYVKLFELAPGCEADEMKLRKINRAMDRSRRAMNPDNYNEDGTVKSRKEREPWDESNKYKKLKAKRKELYRIIAIKRKMAHEILANEIIAVGLDIRVEDMPIKGLQKKSKKTSKKKDGQNRSKKRFGKTIGNRAPAMFVTILTRKAAYYGGTVSKINTRAVKASQYDHEENVCKKKTLSQRYADIGKYRVQRDLYSAFLIENTENTLDMVNRKLCKRKFSNFVKQQNAEIERIKNSNNKTLEWYVTYKTA
ncbi:hypothetical protein SAMN05216391_109109 [Lachnospiraceae bacterium KHCPX20]|nr:hypothetical protein SAMN05216391_109109 [Lachnospiraceae bacterium KHCPX20]